jgi:hypothetical protein
VLTEGSPTLFEFASVEGRQVVAAFDGGAITSDGRDRAPQPCSGLDVLWCMATTLECIRYRSAAFRKPRTVPVWRSPRAC